jgi:hypothetical protein
VNILMVRAGIVQRYTDRHAKSQHTVFSILAMKKIIENRIIHFKPGKRFVAQRLALSYIVARPREGAS